MRLWPLKRYCGRAKTVTARTPIESADLESTADSEMNWLMTFLDRWFNRKSNAPGPCVLAPGGCSFCTRYCVTSIDGSETCDAASSCFMISKSCCVLLLVTVSGWRLEGRYLLLAC